MNNRNFTKLLLMFDVTLNATHMGWKVELQKNKIILRKNRHKLTKNEENMEKFLRIILSPPV